MVIYSQTRLRGFVDEYSSDPQIKEMMSDSQRYSFNLYLKNNKEDVAMFQTLKKRTYFLLSLQQRSECQCTDYRETSIESNRFCNR